MCGSENNHLYLYYKKISEPLISFNFDSETESNNLSTIKTGIPSSSSSIEKPLNSQQQQQQQTSSINYFVSAICWKKVYFALFVF